MKDQEIIQLLQEQRHSFKPYFSDRVLENIQSTAQEKQNDFSRALDYLFPRMSIGAGIAMATILVISYFSHGTLDINTIMGLDTVQQDIFNTGYENLY